ncbi:MAG: DNA mismatch repair protein MutS, partial [Bacteroidales bacterium]|nr:DNA mismatch repair protein MutS [Bacteroidales bacterium]
MGKVVETPLMKQYFEMKKKHPDAVLLFRVGDFYETFSDDAIAASEILGITLTRRANGSAAFVELAGFPHHALDTYLPKLVRAGKRVAICEQLEDPKLTKKLVKRGITELVTPGVNLSESSMTQRDNNFLAAVHFNRTSVGVAFLDISTGEFVCEQGERSQIDKLLSTLQPRELLRMRGTGQDCTQSFTHRCSTFEMDDWVYTAEAATDRLQRHFGTAGLKGFGVDGMSDAIIAAGSILHYLDLTGHSNIGHITSLRRIGNDRFVTLDRFTIRNLELVQPLTPEGMSLLQVLDHTQTPMGGRRLRNWLLFPITDIAEITRRQDAVEYFFKDPGLRDRAGDCLRRMGDLDHLISRLGA